jgi:hypothetical protein
MRRAARLILLFREFISARPRESGEMDSRLRGNERCETAATCGLLQVRGEAGIVQRLYR